MTSPAEKTILPYAPPSKLPGWTTWLMRPVGWPLTISAVIAALLLLVGRSTPGTILPLFLLGLFCWVIIAVLLVMRFVVRMTLILLAKDPTLRIWRMWWRWLWVPGIAVVTFFALGCQAPLTLSFMLSRPAMERLAHEVASSPGPYADRSVGWFAARRIERAPGGMRFIVDGAGFIDGEGFAKFTTPPPPGRSADGWDYAHFKDDWYTAHWRF
ncbi:MAG: hypothetical protein WCI73_13915 [Phycisphaerae bacterium]